MQPGDEEDSDDSSDDGEEAARVLKKIGFPEPTKKPQDSCTLVSACLQKRVMKIEPVVQKLDEITKFKKATEKEYKPNQAHVKILGKCNCCIRVNRAPILHNPSTKPPRT